jgi:hypothetical protein
MREGYAKPFFREGEISSHRKPQKLRAVVAGVTEKAEQVFSGDGSSSKQSAMMHCLLGIFATLQLLATQSQPRIEFGKILELGRRCKQQCSRSTLIFIFMTYQVFYPSPNWYGLLLIL